MTTVPVQHLSVQNAALIPSNWRFRKPIRRRDNNRSRSIDAHGALESFNLVGHGLRKGVAFRDFGLGPDPVGGLDRGDEDAGDPRGDGRIFDRAVP